MTEKRWAGAFRSLEREHGYERCAVEGVFPAEVRGVLYRNGPGLFERFGERYAHWFDADGVVTATRIREDGVDAAVRVVETRGHARERAAGRKLYGGYNTPLARPIRELFFGDSKNPANTGILACGSRVFALCEGGLPYELRAGDLTTVGEESFEGAVLRTFNPHPHRVPSRKTTYSVGVRRGRHNFLDVYALPDVGRVERIASVPVAGLWMAHDFAVTERHVIVVVPPVRMRMMPLLTRKSGFVDALEWDAAKGAILLLIPIDDPANPVRIELASCFVEHFANAWEKDGDLVVEGVTYPTLQTLDRFVKALGHGREEGTFGSALTRFIVDLRTKRVREEVLLRDPHELPQIAPANVGTEHRYTYLVGYAPRSTGRGLWDSVLKVDARSGTVERFTPGDGQYPGEALFVPRVGSTSEDDGYLLVHMFDATNGASREIVLDARDLGRGPIASATLPSAVPVRLHGAFAAAAS